MRIIEVTRQELNVGRTDWVPGAPAHTEPVTAPALIRVDGETAAVVLGLGPQRRLGAALAEPGLPWSDGKGRATSAARLAGFNPKFIAWGFAPPVPLRRRYGCAPCMVERSHERLATAFREPFQRFWATLATIVPDEVAAHETLARESVGADWFIEGLPFTSGVVNHTAALPYHKDAGNLKGCWSAMLVCRRNVEGGLLHLPGLGLWLACNDGDAVFFSGQSELHGVTPVKRIGRGAYRFSLVAYVKAGMRNCAPIGEEHARAARSATAANRRKAER